MIEIFHPRYLDVKAGGTVLHSIQGCCGVDELYDYGNGATGAADCIMDFYQGYCIWLGLLAGITIHILCMYFYCHIIV